MSPNLVNDLIAFSIQYYATVNAGVPSPSVDNVMWLSVDNIEEKDLMIISDIPDLVGSGHSVGGVVSNTVGAIANPESAPMQLQRIVSRCGCQFFFACYGENMDPSSLEEVPPLVIIYFLFKFKLFCWRYLLTILFSVK